MKPMRDQIADEKPEDLPSLIEGLVAFDRGPALRLDAVIAAAALALVIEACTPPPPGACCSCMAMAGG